MDELLLDGQQTMLKVDSGLWESQELPFPQAARGGGDVERVHRRRSCLSGLLAVRPFFRAGYDRSIAVVRDSLGERAFDSDGLPRSLRHTEQTSRPAAGAQLRVTAETIRTFMFTDIVKSTTLVEAIGDEAWEDLLRWHDSTLRSLFARHGGEEIDHAGDGFFVAFKTAPPAIECAVAIQRALADHRRLHGFFPQVRIGLHAAKATYKGLHYRGKGVHQAARIAALAEAGEILASQETLVTDLARFAVSKPRKVTLRGISDPVRVVTIGWH